MLVTWANWHCEGGLPLWETGFNSRKRGADCEQLGGDVGARLVALAGCLVALASIDVCLCAHVPRACLMCSPHADYDFVKTWVAHVKRVGVTGYIVGAMDDELLQVRGE
jgi:hypothetical protein